MLRVNKTPVPREIRESYRTKELLGEVKDNLMKDCVYNDIVCGSAEWPTPMSIEKCEELVKRNFPDLPVDLKDYQIEDLSKSLRMGNVFNINKPGYGKTLETIIWLKTILQKNFKVLILCPKTVIFTWENQLKKYWPGYLNDGMWWITNYQQLYNAENFKRAQEFKWDAIILDESHKIKSMKSKITQIVYKLDATYKHCLTGTPIKNRPQDLAPQLKWLDPYSITTYTDFEFHFCEMLRDNWGWKPQGLTKDKSKVENLQKLLDMYCVGGKEHNLNNMHKPEYIKIRLKLDPKVKKLYDKVIGEYDRELKTRVIDTEGLLEQGIKVSSPIESATRRQQLTSNPQLFDSQLKNVKFEWITDWLEGTDEKVIIISKYATALDELEKLLNSKKFSNVRIKKEDKTTMRQNKVNVWKKSKQALLGTFGLISEGLDGLQEVCRYIIFLDRDWTASSNEQAEGRIFRMGQERQPVIYILQAMGTIDVLIERVQLDKGHDAKELLRPVPDDCED
jgi:SNF2 family DNA or RNA helicase